MRENLIIQVVEDGEQINLVIDDAAYTISTWGNMLGEIENQTDLMEILDGKLDAAEVAATATPGKVLRLNEHGQLVADVIGNATTATEVAWDGVSSKPPTFPPAAHNLQSHPDWPGDVDLAQLAALAGVAGPIQTQINAKQDPLTAGDNIDISGGVVSATDTTYTAGNYLQMIGTELSVSVGTDSSSVAAGDHNHTGVYDPAGTAAGQVAEHESTYNHGKFVSGPESAQSGNLVVFDGVTGKMVKDNGFKFSSKQDKLTAGTNITIDENNAVSAKDTTYTAGDNIDITNEVITYVPTFPIMQPNRIDQNVTVPDGYNAVMFGDFEIAPGVTIECVGNANFIALG